jgi:Lrp/AsnC family leucine-responsive transcriptional regulator
MVGELHEVSKKIDKKDARIIKMLFKDGRMSIADIAKKTNLRRDSVARRIKNLQKDLALTGIVPIINPKAIGLPSVSILLLRLKTRTEKEKKIFLNKLIANKFIVHIAKLIGKYDFYCSILYKDTNHLNKLLEEMKNYVPNLVDDFEVFQVAEEPKFENMQDLF